MGCLVNRSWLVTSRSQMTSASQHDTAGHSGTQSWWHMIYLCCVWVLGLQGLLVLHIAMRSREVSQTKELVSTWQKILCIYSNHSPLPLNKTHRSPASLESPGQIPLTFRENSPLGASGQRVNPKKVTPPGCAVPAKSKTCGVSKPKRWSFRNGGLRGTLIMAGIESQKKTGWYNPNHQPKPHDLTLVGGFNLFHICVKSCSPENTHGSNIHTHTC